MHLDRQDPKRPGPKSDPSPDACAAPKSAAEPTWRTGRELMRVLLAPRQLAIIIGVTVLIGTLMTASFQGLGVFSGREPEEGWLKVAVNYLGTLFIVTLIVAGGHQARFSAPGAFPPSSGPPSDAPPSP